MIRGASKHQEGAMTTPKVIYLGGAYTAPAAPAAATGGAKAESTQASGAGEVAALGDRRQDPLGDPLAGEADLGVEQLRRAVGDEAIG